MTKRKVELWVHTTSGIEFEIREAETGEIIASRWFVVDEDALNAEEIERTEREWVEKRVAELGYELVGEAWS